VPFLLEVGPASDSGASDIMTEAIVGDLRESCCVVEVLMFVATFQEFEDWRAFKTRKFGSSRRERDA
jgi:hypothetical protein